VGHDLSALRAAARAELFALPATLCDEVDGAGRDRDRLLGERAQRWWRSPQAMRGAT